MMKKLEPIDTGAIIENMRMENPWWETGEIDEFFNSMKRRAYFNSFYPLVEDIKTRRAIVLMGPRRVGKTVLMHHAIDKLLKAAGISKSKICLMSIDNPLYLNKGLEELFGLAMQAVGSNEKRNWYVFFDEIQYLKDWEINLKVLVDKYPHTKFIVSGSASVALKYKCNESGAGRFTEFLLPPLTFYEYIHLKEYDDLIISSSSQKESDQFKYFSATDIKALNKHFIDYINFGGYPEVIFSEKIRSNPGLFIKSDIIDKVLLRDLPGLYGINDVQELNAFFATLAYHTSNEFSLDSLSGSSGVEKNVLKKYLEYLEAAYLIKVIHRIDDSAKRFMRMNFFKVYLTNPSIRSALFSPLDAVDGEMGRLVENAIFSQRLQSESDMPRYARWSRGNSKGEVDMVGLSAMSIKPGWAAEIKWSNRYFSKPHELKSLLFFCKKNLLDSSLVTTISAQGVKIVDDLEISFYPASLLAYSLGYEGIWGR